MKARLRILVTMVTVVAMATLLFSCAREQATAAKASGSTTSKYKVPVNPNEEYAWVGFYSTYPMFVAHDQRGWKMACDELGVKSSINGPTTGESELVISALETVISKKVAGIGLIGNDKAYRSTIDKAIDAGIPLVCIDVDVPESKRLAFIGTDWSVIGRTLAEKMVKLLNGKGKVALSSQKGSSMETAVAAYKAEIAKYPAIKIVQEVDSTGQETVVATALKDIMTAHPDLAGISCLDAPSISGAIVALKETGKVGKVKVTTNDLEAGQLTALKDGVAQVALGQERELFNYYGVLSLFTLNHSAIDFQKADNERSLGVRPIPFLISTGLIVVDDSNKDAFISKFVKQQSGSK
jgi:ABC-type sugar transport system substrate-binding protein